MKFSRSYGDPSKLSRGLPSGVAGEKTAGRAGVFSLWGCNMWKRWQTIRLLPLFFFLVACGSPPVVHMVHPQGGVVSCDTKNWDGCYKWNCLDGIEGWKCMANSVRVCTHQNQRSKNRGSKDGEAKASTSSSPGVGTFLTLFAASLPPIFIPIAVA